MRGVLAIPAAQPIPGVKDAAHARRPDALPHGIAACLIQKWLRFRVVENTVALLESALGFKDRHQIPYWDAAILAAAKAARCREVFSEVLNHGQNYDGVCVVNPFLSGVR